MGEWDVCVGVEDYYKIGYWFFLEFIYCGLEVFWGDGFFIIFDGDGNEICFLLICFVGFGESFVVKGFCYYVLVKIG